MRLTRARGPAGKRHRSLTGRAEKGFVLIELLISIAIFGVISVGFLSALVAGYHGVIVAHDVTTAESLTRTELENVRNAQFPVADYETTTSKYDVVVRADYVTSSTVTEGVAVEYEIVATPSSLQMITVTVRHHDSGRTILVTTELKVQA